MPIIFYIVFFLLLAYGILISFYKSWWQDIPIFDPAISAGSSVKITVIIPARDEEDNIGECLNSLMRQSYPRENMQIIVVNDHSADATAAIVAGYAPNGVQLINLADYVNGTINSYKKKAIETAISQSIGDLIVTTDADCTFPVRWLETLAAFYVTNNAAFISAPVRIRAGARLLTIFQALDFLSLQGITGASVHRRFHSMCNGANMAYERKIFYEVDGFKNIDSIASGDDMLLMHKIYLRYPDRVFYLKSQDAIVTTLPASDWKAFIRQRVRWASKADKYDDVRIKAVLLLVYLLNLLLLALVLIGISKPLWLLAAFLLIAVKTVIELFFMRSVARFFNMGRLLTWFPFLQPIHIVYTVVVGFLGLLGSYEWKGRKVK